MPVVYFFTKKSAKSRTLLAAKILFYFIVLLTGGVHFSSVPYSCCFNTFALAANSWMTNAAIAEHRQKINKPSI